MVLWGHKYGRGFGQRRNEKIIKVGGGGGSLKSRFKKISKISKSKKVLKMLKSPF